jgi:hydrogenase maturation protease
MERGIAIVGIGNLLLSDDGVGIHAVRMLRDQPGIAAAARVIDGGTVGTNLLAEVAGCENLLVLDAVDAGLSPGAVIWMDLRRRRVSTDQHSRR